MILGYEIQTMVFIAITFVIAISLHEFAHARAADKLWDPTPRLQWRLTPNPLKHIDPLWFILIFIIQFGRGRPVQINPAYFKNALRDELLVAVAWPAMNILLALFGIMVSAWVAAASGVENTIMNWTPLYDFWSTFAQLNVVLAVFNMLPIPPLDGYRIIQYLFPATQRFFLQYWRYIWMIAIAILLVPNPVGSWLQNLIMIITKFLYAMLARPFDNLLLFL